MRMVETWQPLSINHYTVEVSMNTDRCVYIYIYPSIEFAAWFHAQIEDWRDRDEIVPREQESWQIVQRK